jgi:cytidylate kinase
MRSGRVVIAIDGPAGVGKSATARELARRLDLPYLDTGAMYRAVALASMRRGFGREISALEHDRIGGIAERCRIEFMGVGTEQRVVLDGEDVTETLREPEVTQMASIVSAIPAVRRDMVRRQRELGARGGGVIEGRDIGTVVFPDATLKVFLTARPEVRAQRRFDEMRRRGVDVGWDDVLREQRVRDERDATRSDSPLRPAKDSITLDTSTLSLEQVVGAILTALASAP